MRMKKNWADSPARVSPFGQEVVATEISIEEAIEQTSSFVGFLLGHRVHSLLVSNPDKTVVTVEEHQITGHDKVCRSGSVGHRHLFPDL